jgi:hypothetical protein
MRTSDSLCLRVRRAHAAALGGSAKPDDRASWRNSRGTLLKNKECENGTSFRTTQRSIRIPRAIFLLLFCLLLATTTPAQQTSPRPELDPTEATKLAELMCRQLPNVGTILEVVRIQTPNGPAPAAPSHEPMVIDDVYDALVRLGPYSLPCLTDRLLDTRWMPDPRSEPLLGAPLVGDVAYMILMDKGVQDILPTLGHQPPDMPGMLYYLWWPSVGNHRQRLQTAIRAWVLKHPHCCGGPPMMRPTAPSRVQLRMSTTALAKARVGFSRLRPGVSPAEVLKITGKPDAIDPGGDSPDHFRVSLLGFCANDHNEHLAYIYFTERWTDDVARRDPLRDRYVIVFFSAEGKMTRMFSNVAGIPPIFPQNKTVWERLMWGPPPKK